MSRKIYLVKKDPKCKKENVEWLQPTGRDFFKFLASPESKGRYFIRLRDDVSFECDDIFIEATLEQYKEWRSENNAHHYLKMIQKDYITLSFDAPTDDGEFTLHDIVANDYPSVEDETVKRIEWSSVVSALESLPACERFIIDSYYSGECKTDSDIARAMGISQQVLNRKRKRIIKKIIFLVGV